VPKQGRDALHEVMNNAGWRMELSWFPNGGSRKVSFSKMNMDLSAAPFWVGEDANDWLAAVEALRAELNHDL
jgi:hypothetical protein